MSIVANTLSTQISDISLFFKEYPSTKINLSYNNISIQNVYANLYLFLTKCTNLIDLSITNVDSDIIYTVAANVGTNFYISNNSLEQIFHNIKTKYNGYNLVELFLYNIPNNIEYHQITVNISKMIYLIYNSIMKDKVDIYLYNIFNNIIKTLHKDTKYFSIFLNYTIQTMHTYILLNDKIYPIILK